jgi:hypothetical protein
MKLCFVSVNGPREPYLLDEPRISSEELEITAADYFIFMIVCGRLNECTDCFIHPSHG